MKELNIDIIKKYHSINEICINLYGYCNGRTINTISNFISDNTIDICHFDAGFNNRKYKIITKECPVCGKEFETQKGSKKETNVCSHSCSNIIRGSRSQETKNKISESLTGKKNPRWKEEVMRICVICEKEFEVWRNVGGISPTKTCSNKCRTKLRSMNAKKMMKERIENGLHKGWNSRSVRSYPELFFEDVLKNNNIFDKCIVEYKIKKRDLGL